MPPPIKKPFSTPPAPPAPPRPQADLPRRVLFSSINETAGHRVVLYGTGGIGKTTLATFAPGPVAVFDLDESLPRLKSQLTHLPGVVTAATWVDLRGALQSQGWDEVKTIVIDTVTRAEDLCIAHTLATVPHEKGHKVSKLEDYGYGKGYQFVFETFLPLLGDLDRHCRAGRHVILIAHDCTHNVPNPSGEDWLRYEPKLQDPPSGKASIRLRVKEWADHLLFLGYDTVVTKEGKGLGSGTRTLWPAELPHCMAKSRTTQTPIAITTGETVWGEIIK